MCSVEAQTPAAYEDTGRGARSAARAVYVRATDPEASLPGGRLLEEIRAELHGLAAETQPAVLSALRSEAGVWAAEEVRRYRSLLGRVEPDDARAVLARRAALACAPLALVSGAWLQWMSDPANADDPNVLRILSVYASDVGSHTRASRGSAYLILLRRLGLSEYGVPTARLTLDQRIPDAAFYVPALLLAMSRRPDAFAAEILGADLCLRTVGMLPPLAAIEAVHPTAADWDLLDPSASRQPDHPSREQEIRVAVEGAFVTGGGGTGEGVVLGFGWALSALRRWSAQLHADLDASLDPAHEMGELLRLRAREAGVYHRNFQLQGRSLSEWLKGCATDPLPLLSALATSRLIEPGRSGVSRLINELIGEGGPMFRIFGPDDVSVIRRWIDSLPTNGAGAEAPPKEGALLDEVPPLSLPSLNDALEEGHLPADLREAYHLLQARADTAALRRYALAYVRGWLRRSRHRINRSELPLPDYWGPEGLRPWLAEQHDRHNREFEEGLEVALPSRDALIDSTVQLAPLTLIDGGWLRGFTDYELASSEIGHSLFETYWDELGNGQLHLNHPRIYREVLDEMGIHLAPTRSPEFARWPGFRDSSFELPVYWLCIGRFPQTFLPELLGLNLAMELSGVGGTYRRARMALKAHGFSTRFVDIHNTIDNVASGHSAWAADAVDTYLASLPASQSPGVRAEAWERIRTGYRSLNPPSGFWARFAARWAPLWVIPDEALLRRRPRARRSATPHQDDDLAAAAPRAHDLGPDSQRATRG